MDLLGQIAFQVLDNHCLVFIGWIKKNSVEIADYCWLKNIPI